MHFALPTLAKTMFNCKIEMKPTSLSIVLPTYNEAATMREVLDRVWSQDVCGLQKQLIIIESNSTDGTREIVREFVSEQASNSIVLIEEEKPQGKGHAVRAGLTRVTGDIVLIQDGDLEYDFGEYPILLQPILDGKTDFVLGSRHLSAGSWKIRKFESTPFKAIFMNFGGMVFHSFFNLLYWQSLTDPTTMFKVFKRKCLEKFILESNRFDFDFELLAKLIRSGYSPFEVPITYRSRGFEEGKKIRVFRDPFTWIRAIVKYRFSKLK